MNKFTVKKTYGHDRGYTVAFRQWRADTTHCSLLHGYALAFTFVVEGSEVDHRNWLISFGEFKEIKAYLDATFDHTTLVAKDDPQLHTFLSLERVNAARLIIMDRVGCEAIAEEVFNKAYPIISHKSEGRARLVSVEVAEHGANSVVYQSE